MTSKFAVPTQHVLRISRSNPPGRLCNCAREYRVNEIPRDLTFQRLGTKPINCGEKTAVREKQF